jgi:hypothetical protein
MNRRAVWRFGAIMVGGMLAMARTARAAPPLASWRWRSRLLLVFAPGPDNTDLLDQRRLLATDQHGGAVRDLVTIEIVRDDAAIAGRADASLDGARIRREYQVPPERFTLILLGKDGGEKVRRTHPMSADMLFGLIDRMPMGRTEAQRRADKGGT